MARELPPFDPYALLGSLDRANVTYIVIGAFARVIQGAEEITDGLDIVPSQREENLRQLHSALEALGVRRADGGLVQFRPRLYACRLAKETRWRS